MQGFCNKTYNNAQDIIGWDTNEGKNFVEKGTTVISNASDVGTGECSMSEGEVNMV